MKNGYQSCLVFIAALSACPQAFAGAWTQEKGAAQVIVTGSYYHSDEFQDNSGHKRSQADYSKYELNPYIEYGYTSDVTLGANLSLQRASQDASGATAEHSNLGLGDSELFLRKRLWQKDGFVVSAEPLIKLPSPSSSNSDLPRLGNPHADAALGLSGGYGFSQWGFNHFADIGTQYRYRFGPQKDQIRLSATAGIGVANGWTVMPQLFQTWRAQSSSNAGFTESSADDYEQTRLQISALYRFTESTDMQVGGFSDVAGKNTGRGGGVLIGLWKRL